jgi:hypothetical protein
MLFDQSQGLIPSLPVRHTTFSCFSSVISSVLDPNSDSTSSSLHAGSGGRVAILRGVSRHRDGLTDQADTTLLLIRNVLSDTELRDLGVVEHLVDRVDLAAGHARGMSSDPGVRAFLFPSGG